MRVLQLNIWARYGPYATREPLLRRLFADLAPDLIAMQEVDGDDRANQAAQYWADSFALAGDGSPGHTWTSDSPYVQPFAEAVLAEPVHHRRIDYVFVGSPIRWKPRIVIRSARVVGVWADEGAPSDHYGVLADLELDGDTVGRGRGLDAWDETKEGLWTE